MASDRTISRLSTLLALGYFALMMAFGSTLILHYPDERHYAYGGAHMVEGGDWLIPQTPEGAVRLKKPILPYWFSAAGFEVLGIGVAGFRLFWVVGAAATLVLTFRLALRLGASPPTALLAEAMLAGNLLFLRATVNAIPDIPLTLFMTISTIGFVRLVAGDDERPSEAAWLAWIGVALAILSKGLLPLVFAAVVIGHAAIFARRRLPALLAPAPIAVALLLALSWYVVAVIRYPAEFTAQFFGDQITEKMTETAVGPLLAFPGYLAAALASFLGWPLILAIGALRARPRIVWRDLPPAVQMLLAWAVAICLTFSIGGFVAGRYLLPILPPLAALMAIGLATVFGTDRLAGICRLLAPLAAGIGFLATLVLFLVEADLAPAAEATAFGLVALAAWAAVAWFGGRQREAAPCLLAVTPVIAIGLSVLPLSRLSLPDLGEALATRLAAAEPTEGEPVFVGSIHVASALRLHLGKADGFREATRKEAGEACTVMTTLAPVAEALRQRGYAVEPVTAGWRALEPTLLLAAIADGRLAEARAENAETAWFATCPPSPAE